MKMFAIGTGSTVIVTALLYLLFGFDAAKQVETIISMLIIAILIILSGTLHNFPGTTGHIGRTRNPYEQESAEDRSTRNRVITKLFLFGIPHIVVTFLLYI